MIAPSYANSCRSSISPRTPRTSTRIISTPPRQRATTVPIAMPVTPICGPSHPNTSAADTVIFTAFTAIMIAIGVRMSPAARMMPLPTRNRLNTPYPRQSTRM